MKHILIESGARVVFLLERTMAVALGHSTVETVPKKRTYLLFDQDIIQVFAVDGMEVAIDYTCETEMDYFMDSRNSSFSMLGNNEVTPAAKERISALLSDLKERGFMESGIYVWGSTGEEQVHQILADNHRDGIAIKQEYAIQGALDVFKNIKKFF